MLVAAFHASARTVGEIALWLPHKSYPAVPQSVATVLSCGNSLHYCLFVGHVVLVYAIFWAVPVTNLPT
jgi:hypothetical protein